MQVINGTNDQVEYSIPGGLCQGVLGPLTSRYHKAADLGGKVKFYKSNAGNCESQDFIAEVEVVGHPEAILLRYKKDSTDMEARLIR